MPNCLLTKWVKTKLSIEIMQQIAKETQKEYLANRKGKAKNIGKVGNTYQKVKKAWFANFAVACPSRYIQINAIMVTNGNAAIKAPILSLRFATSEIATTIAAVVKYLNTSHPNTHFSPHTLY